MRAFILLVLVLGASALTENDPWFDSELDSYNDGEAKATTDALVGRTI